MPATVGYLVIDSTNPQQLLPFWCSLLDVQVAADIGDGQFLVLSPTANGLRISFQRVPEPKQVKNRLHLDMVVPDLDAATAEIEALGGRWLEPGTTRELDGYIWRVMADPEDNEFDIVLASG
jgi:predicted enzyme related to lactoylglutathione lyase